MARAIIPTPEKHQELARHIAGLEPSTRREALRALDMLAAVGCTDFLSALQLATLDATLELGWGLAPTREQAQAALPFLEAGEAA